MLLDLDTELPVGKYQGETVAEVLEKDPDYIRWAAENWEEHTFTEEVEDRIPYTQEEPCVCILPRG